VTVTDLAVDLQDLPRALSPGLLLGARYRLDRIAGAGGMASVWRAYDERLQRPVAIKVISGALGASPAAVARFAREARTHAGIQHPNLVRVYDYAIAADQPYLVMEYVDGATLSKRLDRGGLSAAAIRTLALELLSAVACVHDHGVLHRDIKCGNVLLDRQGHVRLTDFGLARLEGSTHLTRPNKVVGTLRFLAPELIQGQPASRQSDLYALGVLLRTAAKRARPHAPLAKLTRWLTQKDPRTRPADAHIALEFLGERPRLAPASDVPQHPGARRLRSRNLGAQAVRIDLHP
jgi:eukaryotic-like serine/threonine-protein kinase